MIISLKKILPIPCRKDSIFFNVHGAVLSFSFVIIIFMKGVMIGWDHQSKTDM
ncbi:MAG: hypothetical protein H6Q94_679, partial [Nitrospirae bacterium]|nr:hypothetical protein [Nitrospirota bacterium]